MSRKDPIEGINNDAGDRPKVGVGRIVNGGVTFAKIEGLNEEGLEGTARSAEYRLVSDHDSSRKKRKGVDKHIPGSGIDKELQGAMDAALEGSQDTNALLNSREYRLDLRAMIHSPPSESTTERNLEERDFKRLQLESGLGNYPKGSDQLNFAKKGTDFNLYPTTFGHLLAARSNGGQNSDTDRASFSLVEELSQQIVRLNSANSALRMELDKLRKATNHKGDVAALEARINDLLRENTQLKSELNEARAETKITITNFKRFYEETIQDIDKKHRKQQEQLKRAYEKELESARKENLEFSNRLKDLERMVDNNEITILGLKDRQREGLVFKAPVGFSSAIRSRSDLKFAGTPTKESTEDADDQRITLGDSEMPAQVIISPKPASPLVEKSPGQENFYCDSEIDDFHAYMQGTHDMDKPSQPDTSDREITKYVKITKCKPIMNSPGDRSKSKEASFEGLTALKGSREKISAREEEKTTKRSRKSRQPSTHLKPKDVDKSASNVSDKKKSTSRIAPDKKEPSLRIHKTVGKDLAHPIHTILNLSKSKTALNKQSHTNLDKYHSSVMVQTELAPRSQSKKNEVSREPSGQKTQAKGKAASKSRSNLRGKKEQLQQSSFLLGNQSIGGGMSTGNIHL